MKENIYLLYSEEITGCVKTADEWHFESKKEIEGLMIHPILEVTVGKTK